MACSMRGRPNLGSGSPKAADSPKTNIRTVSGAFTWGIENGYGTRARRGPKNRQLNRLFWTKTFRPSRESGNKKAVGWP